MTNEKIEFYKKELERERRMVSNEIKESEKPQSAPDINDWDEETDEAEEISNQMAVANDLKTRLSEIDIALEKINEGKYGVCEKCGKPIENEVLDISPESRFCRECKLKK
ncbi:MAG: TraR/DksA C4-type zinc finger protein [Patescibacteria group bacterium]|nr:TraR/DksA C4-type zinc finger protein [Patescibacteria group bacterium]